MKLFSKGANAGVTEPIVGRITTMEIGDQAQRADHVFLARGERALPGDLAGYAGLVALPSAHVEAPPLPVARASDDLSYLADGDVVLLLPSGNVNVLYRRSSRHNTILATEQCNSLCLMCSQPPKVEDDRYRVQQILRLLELVDQDCFELGISGGEPTLFGKDFLKIIEKAKERLPKTALHVLSNGRLFKDETFAAALGAIQHPDLMLGIPLYSDIDELHDFVVQARGAFDETIIGFYNLAKHDVRIEIRVVLHRQTYARLPQLADFICRNFPFASHVTLMGLEMFGYTNLNLDLLWIDPFDYQDELTRATHTLARAGMKVSIYNHQLCVIPRALWFFARKSISDWKNIYVDECTACVARESCGGFFHSAAKRHSSHIRAISSAPPNP